MDTCGPFLVLTPHKKSFFWAILDDKSNFGPIALLAAKNDVFDAYQIVEALLEAKSGNCVVAVHMDGAKELCLGRLEDHFISRGVVMQVTVPYAHSQNGKIEQYIWTIEDGFQMLLVDSGLSMTFWGDAALTTNYLCNCVPTVTLPNNITPFEEMEHVKPNLSHLRVWGCQCFAAIPPELCTKGGPCQFEAIFVGYEENHIGWRVCDLHGKYHFSRDVIFNELVPGCFSSHHKSPPSSSSSFFSPTSSSPSSSPNPSSPPPSSSPPPPRPACQLTHTVKGNNYADSIQIRDKRLAARQLKGPHPQQTLSAVSDFVSFLTTDDLLHSEFMDDLDPLEPDAIFPSVSSHQLIVYVFSALHIMIYASLQNHFMKLKLDLMQMYGALPCIVKWTLLRNTMLLSGRCCLLIIKPLVFVGAMPTNST